MAKKATEIIVQSLTDYSHDFGLTNEDGSPKTLPSRGDKFPILILNEDEFKKVSKDPMFEDLLKRHLVRVLESVPRAYQDKNVMLADASGKVAELSDALGEANGTIDAQAEEIAKLKAQLADLGGPVNQGGNASGGTQPPNTPAA